MATRTPSAFSSLLPLLRHHLHGRHRRKSTHNLEVLFLAHALIRLANFRQYLEVINIKGWRVCVEEFGGLVGWI